MSVHPLSSSVSSKSSKALGKRIYRKVKNPAQMLIGLTSAAFGLESFLLPNNFIDGGATGISLLITEITQAPLGLILLLVNIPFILMGYYQFGKEFARNTALAIIGLAACITLFTFPIITNDRLLVAVFGGFFLGLGIGFTIRGGGVLDGTEILAISVSRNVSVSIGDVILGINILIFTSAALLLSVDTALYSLLTYLAASKTVDFIIEGIEEYTAVTIISEKSALIREMISQKLGRGITVYQGKGGFGKKGHSEKPLDILYTIVTRLEIAKLKMEIEQIDEEAFVVMNSIKDTKGGMIKKRPLKK